MLSECLIQMPYIDAMSISWENHFSYLLPPFSIIQHVLNKISLESTKAPVIAPMWPTQSWFHKLLELAVDQPMIIESKSLQLPGTNQKHPLYSKLRLLPVMCTRDQYKQAQFRKNSQCPQCNVERQNENKYKYIFRRQEKFCSERNYNTMQINTDIVLEFLTLEYNRGLSYNAIKNVLSAISSYLPHEVRHHNIIKKFMKSAKLTTSKNAISCNMGCQYTIKLFAKNEYRQ